MKTGKPILAGWQLVATVGLMIGGGLVAVIYGGADAQMPGIGLITGAAGLVIPTAWKRQ